MIRTGDRGGRVSLRQRGHVWPVRGIATVTVAALLGAWLVPIASASDDLTDTFADPDLAACVASALEVAPGAPITAEALASLTDLTCDDIVLRSFEGLDGATALTTLSLDGWFSLEGAYPEEILEDEFFLPLTELENLTTIDFTEMFLSDDVNLAPLATTPSLRSLSVKLPYGTGLEWVTGATNLESLRVDAGGSIGDATPLASLTGLTSLSVEFIQDSLTPIASLTRLRSLGLVSANATDWDSLSALTELRDLDVEYSNVPNLDFLSELTELRSVGASSTPIADISPIAGAEHLESLRFSMTEVTDLSPVATLPALTELVAQCPDDADPSPVAEVTTLEVLYLTYCDIDDATLFSGMTDLRELWIGNNKLRDLRPLAGLTKLTSLHALNQYIELAPRDVCVPYELEAAYDVDGSRLEPKGLSSSWGAYENGIMTWATAGNSPHFTFKNPSENFSGKVVVPTNPGPAYANCPFVSAPAVTISGTAEVGSTLTTAFDGAWSPGPAGWTEQLWMRDGISGLDNGLSYVVQPSDAGHTITFRLKGNRPGFEVKEVLSNAIYIPLTFDSAWSPTLSITPSVGHTATIAPPQAFPIDGTMTCTWKLDGVVVSQGTSCAYTAPSSAGGKALAASVSLTAPGYTAATFAIAPKSVLKALGQLHMIGRINEGAASSTVDAGAKLTATLPTYAGATPTAIAVHWTRNGAPISGATGRAYITTSADAGKKIGAVFTATRSGYRTETSQAIDVISVRSVFTAKPTPVIAGTKAVGFTLTAAKGTWTPTPTTYSYQWYRNGKAISGATRASYKASTADGGQKLTVKVTAKRSGYTTSAKTSASTTIAKRLTATPTPTVSGTAAVRSTLTVRTGTWGPGTVSKSYQWYRNGKAISGATKSTYRASAKDAYASITVRVTGKKSGYLSVSRTSKTVVPSGIKYANCSALLLDYPGGVAQSTGTVDMISGVPGGGILTTTFVSSKLYALNPARDGDKDGWACEPN